MAGRPPLFGFGNTTVDLAMFWYYHKSKPRGRVQSSAPALTTDRTWSKINGYLK